MTTHSPSVAQPGNPSAGRDGIRRTSVARPDGGMPISPEQLAAERRQNVGHNERVLGGIAGAALVLLGLKRGSLGGLVAAGIGGMLAYRSYSGHCPAYAAMGIDTRQDTAARPEDYYERGVHVEQSYTIDRPLEEVYAFWRDFTNLPTFMEHLRSVEVLSPTRSRWTAKAPLLGQVSWEAEIIHDQPNELIAWKSVENSTVANAGTVTFRRKDTDGRSQTEVRVVLDYIPPAGVVGQSIAQLFGEEPSQTIREDLRRLKVKMESGCA